MGKTRIAILLLGISTLALISLCMVQRMQIQSLSASRGSPELAVRRAPAASSNDAAVAAPRPQGERKIPMPAATRSGGESVTGAVHAITRTMPSSVEAGPATMTTSPSTNNVAVVPTNESPMAGIAQMLRRQDQGVAWRRELRRLSIIRSDGAGTYASHVAQVITQPGRPVDGRTGRQADPCHV